MDEQDMVERSARHKKRVERRAKFLATLSPHQRKRRDKYISWVRHWRAEYKDLVLQITRNKTFIRKQGHNNLASLKLAMHRLEDQKRRARMMLLAREAGKVEYQLICEGRAELPPPPEAVEVAA